MTDEGKATDDNGMALIDIEDPQDSDVLCGRGGAALRHPGNQTYRRLVHLNKGLYITCLKAEKLKISRSIVAAIREQDGRFLERNTKKGTWYDIGDKKAMEKTSQALREGQPKLRQKIVELGGGAAGAAALLETQFPAGSMYQMSQAQQQAMAQQQMEQHTMVAMQQHTMMTSMSEMPPPQPRDMNAPDFLAQMAELATPTIQEEPGSMRTSLNQNTTNAAPAAAELGMQHNFSTLSLMSDFSTYATTGSRENLSAGAGATAGAPYHQHPTPNSQMSATGIAAADGISAAMPPPEGVKRSMDRRQHFAGMKYSRPPSGRFKTGGSHRQLYSSNKQLYASNKSLYASNKSLYASNKSLDGMPDIHLVESNPSLFSQNSAGDQQGRVPDVANVFESRRSLMSGLSRISDTSDVNSIFSDLSRKIGNVSTRSIAMSEISGMDEHAYMDDLDPDTIPTARMDDFWIER